MLGIAAHPARRSTPPRPGLRRERALAREPDRRVRLDAGHIGEAEGRDVGPQARIGAIAGVHQHDTARDAGLKGRSDLVERDLRRSWLEAPSSEA